MRPLDRTTELSRSAALGWMDLGNCQEAICELDHIAPRFLRHPEILELRWLIYVKAKKWDLACDVAKILRNTKPDNPNYWIWLACATRDKSSGGLVAACKILGKAHKLFPKDATIVEGLACYSYQLGKLDRAQKFMKTAIALSHPVKIKNRKGSMVFFDCSACGKGVETFIGKWGSIIDCPHCGGKTKVQ